MAQNLNVVVVDDKANELFISIEQIGPNVYRFNLSIVGEMFRVTYPLTPYARNQMFRKLWYETKQHPTSFAAKISVINYLIEKDFFEKGDPPSIIEVIMQVIRQQVVSTHVMDKTTGLPIKPRCIHQAEKMLNIDSQAMVIFDSNGKVIPIPKPIDPNQTLKRKLTV
jgi:hypothetical protein